MTLERLTLDYDDTRIDDRWVQCQICKRPCVLVCVQCGASSWVVSCGWHRFCMIDRWAVRSWDPMSRSLSMYLRHTSHVIRALLPPKPSSSNTSPCGEAAGPPEARDGNHTFTPAAGGQHRTRRCLHTFPKKKLSSGLWFILTICYLHSMYSTRF